MAKPYHHRAISRFVMLVASFTIVALIGTLYAFQYYNLRTRNTSLASSLDTTQEFLASRSAELAKLKGEDQYKKNKDLEDKIKNIETTYGKAVDTYEELLRFRDHGGKTTDLEKEYAAGLTFLTKDNFSSAEATLITLEKDIAAGEAKLAASYTIPANMPVDNTPPGAGYKRSVVHTDFGDFLVDVVAADLNSSRVIVDTASDGTCHDNCPVMSLGAYAGRSGAFAAINGPYFCPASYPSCAGKTNSFDTLLMNKNKVYFNSENNVYSTVPAVIFSGTSVRYVGASQEWGRDTGVDAVIANQPLMVIGGNVVFGGDAEAKRAGAGARSFIGNSGTTVYIGVVYNASVAQAARVIKAMGIQNALNLDDGGSTALMSGGRYVTGPGRDLPFGILLVHK